MLKNISIIFLNLVILWGCASKKVDTDKDGNDLAANGIPKWVYAPNEACNEAAFLCASGQGPSMDAGDASAKKSLASIFETNIKSNFQLHTNSYSSEQRSQLTEQVMSEVQESLDVILQAVEVKKRFEQGDAYYSLVALDKRKAKKTLQQQIKDIDAQMDHLYREQERINITKLLILLDKRQMLNERLIIIAGSGISSRYTYSKITDLKYRDGGSKLKVEYSEDFPQSMRKWFEGKLSNSGFEIVGIGQDYVLQMKLSAKQEYLNVRGFEKFSFSVEGSASNNSGEQVGSLSVNKVASGRNQTDAFLKVKMDLQNQISEKLEDLNIK